MIKCVAVDRPLFWMVAFYGFFIEARILLVLINMGYGVVSALSYHMPIPLSYRS